MKIPTNPQAVEALGFEYHICRSLEDFKDLVSSNVKVSAITENS